MTVPPGLRQLLGVFAVVAVAALVAAAILLLVIWRRVRRIKVAPGTGFWGTLRQVPLGLVVLLDLLDLGLDVFSAPLIWWLLGRLQLRQLRQVASVEALIPFTGILPTMTLCWLLARFGMQDPPRRGGGHLLEAEQVAPGKWRPRA
jgi:hypothetical protein